MVRDPQITKTRAEMLEQSKFCRLGEERRAAFDLGKVLFIVCNRREVLLLL